jgi:hypothetical protein
MSLKNLLKRLILEEVDSCRSCQDKKPRLGEAERVEIPHKELLKKSASFKNKLSNKNYLINNCGFKEAEFSDMLITFRSGNAKLNHAFMSLPAGVSCPGAGECLSFFNPEDGKLYIAQENKGKICYAAAKEAGQGPSGERGALSYRKEIYSNFYIIENTLKSGGYNALAELITKSIEEYELKNNILSEIRIHEDGDFYNEKYFKAWLKAAIMNRNTLFYFYTKSLPYLINYLRNNPKFPSNFVVNISSEFNPIYKNQFEYYKSIGNGDYKIAKIYNSYDDVPENIPIDRTDAFAMDLNYRGEFALVYHGTGLKGSQAAKFARKNSLDPRKEKTKEDTLHYITTVKKIRERLANQEIFNVNLDY